MATPGQARRLMEIDGIELRGTARVVAYGAAACHIRERNHSEEEYERLKVNEDKPLDLWQLDFSVYNGSGKALDHMIARYGIESPWPPCTNWSDNPGVSTTGALWSDKSGFIQRSGKPFSVAPGETLTEEVLLVVFHEDEPRFANWSVDYNFAEGTHAAPGIQPPQAQAEPSVEQPTQAQTKPPAEQPTPAQPAQTRGLPSGIGAGETCAGKPKGSTCWMELDNQPGCYVWVNYFFPHHTMTWSAECYGGLAQGEGTLTLLSGEDITNHTGRFQDGKKHGQWVEPHIILNLVEEGPYVDGKRHGQWVERAGDSNVDEGPYVDGKKHGQWVERFTSFGGSEWEGPYVNGERHGLWVLRYADGAVQEGPFVDGKRTGRWIVREADGTVHEGNYVDDERHGQWVSRTVDGSVNVMTWVNGEWVD